MMPKRPEVLIEQWLPIETIGAESMRDASAAKKPPLNRLHVWWARRPLTASRAAILASVLPAWSVDWPAHLKKNFPTEGSYHDWFLKLCGIFGDPVQGRKLIQWAKDRNIKLKDAPYSHRRAFSVSPAAEYLDTLWALLRYTWGTGEISVLDPFAGGGSIPFEAMRYGFKTYANELNPVACVILTATLAYPAKFGTKLADDVLKYGNLLSERVRRRLEPFFPRQLGESIQAYIWARTVRCPYTGKPIPLSPNWWLQKGAKPVAIRPIFDADADETTFEIVSGKGACAKLKPDNGTVRHGEAISPWAQNQPVDGDYIKQEAQAGRMGQQLCAIAVKRGDLQFRAAEPDDLRAVKAADLELKKRLPEWEARGWVPNEPRRAGRADWAAEVYGHTVWKDTYCPRQLLSMLTILEETKRLAQEIDSESDRALEIITLLALSFDKAVDYNSRQAAWHPSRAVVAHAFTRHDFSHRWSHAEFDAARNLMPWAVM